MITLVSAAKKERAEAGDWYLAVMTATEEPAKSNITVADVEGASDDDRFVAGSVIICPASNWVAFSDGQFSAKSGGE